jgi:hypothetical protein
MSCGAPRVRTATRGRRRSGGRARRWPCWCAVGSRKAEVGASAHAAQDTVNTATPSRRPAGHPVCRRSTGTRRRPGCTSVIHWTPGSEADSSRPITGTATLMTVTSKIHHDIPGAHRQQRPSWLSLRPRGRLREHHSPNNVSYAKVLLRPRLPEPDLSSRIASRGSGGRTLNHPHGSANAACCGTGFRDGEPGGQRCASEAGRPPRHGAHDGRIVGGVVTVRVSAVGWVNPSRG